jgi:hypothetical protein
MSYIPASRMTKRLALYHQLRRARLSLKTGDRFSFEELSGMEHLRSGGELDGEKQIEW